MSVATAEAFFSKLKIIRYYLKNIMKYAEVVMRFSYGIDWKKIGEQFLITNQSWLYNNGSYVNIFDDLT